MTRTNRLLLALVVLTAAVSAFWFLALAPKREEAALLAEQIAAKQVELDTARSQVATYEKARAAYPANYATVARLGKAVPADDDVRSLMVQIDSAARRTGVEFQLIDVGKGGPSAGRSKDDDDPAAVIPGAIANAGGFSTLPMSFAFQGSYFELSSFLTRLERFVTVSNRRIDVTGRLLLLQSISLVPDAKGFPAMRAQINASSYLVPPAEKLASGAAPATPTTPATGSTRSSAAPATTTATSTGAVR
jgi:Tfp pilus assembly protein PilO